MYDVIVVGGGASGFFVSNLLLEQQKNLKILILEKTGKVLQKVKISGGGRCNVTHNEPNQTHFSQNYPRGQKFLKKALREFGQKEMIAWLNKHDVDLKIEQDNRMFPTSNSSQTIIDCFSKVLKKTNCQIKYNQALTNITIHDNCVDVITNQEKYNCKKLIVSTGSSKGVWSIFNQHDIKTTAPVPSLFTFKLKAHPLVDLAGISIPNAHIKIANTKLSSTGPWLITHQGISGPAVLKLSAFGARVLHDKQYDFTVFINFTKEDNWDNVAMIVKEKKKSQKLITNDGLFLLPKRLWLYLVKRSGISETKKWSEISKKESNKLTEELYQGAYEVLGKNTFKDEFVTAGGLDLNEINPDTCQLKKNKNIYVIGECLNIDGITGGFNFQACWTTAFLASRSVKNELG